MINLLPPVERQDIVYARRNTQLWHWLVVGLLAVAGMFVMTGVGRIIIDRSAQQTVDQVEDLRAQLATQKIDETQKRVKDISGSLKLANDVLSRQVIVSDLLEQLATVLPSGSSLASIELGELGGGIDLAVNTADIATATQVEINFKDPGNKLFEKADTVSINCNGTEDPRYNCTASFRVLFAKDSPFKLVNTEAKQ